MLPRHARLPVRAALALALVAGAAAACAPTTRVHGFVPSQADVSRITPGIDDAFTVEEVLGRPSASGLLTDGSWYYVQSTVQNLTYHAPRVVDRTVLAVSFDPNGIVTGIDRYGIEDGRVINLTTRVTETGGRQMGVLEQLFGNVLNIDASQLAEP
jgi:outer membrane protein assembly factor BamE (lipoprotein component of BamABCDE complex)